MDPRHPELAVSRLKELIKQYDRIEKDMANVTTFAKIGELEREGGLVIQEICLVAPRIHEAMMQTSRNRRRDLTNGVNQFGYVPEEKTDGGLTKATIGIEKEEPKPKKKTTKKKTTKKKAE